MKVLFGVKLLFFLRDAGPVTAHGGAVGSQNHRGVLCQRKTVGVGKVVSCAAVAGGHIHQRLFMWGVLRFDYCKGMVVILEITVTQTDSGAVKKVWVWRGYVY